VFDAEGGGVRSRTALQNPFDEDVTLVKNFLSLYHMSGVLTDTHFMQRDRMGRLLTFAARYDLYNQIHLFAPAFVLTLTRALLKRGSHPSYTY
jgi:hypothetical protein